MEELLDEEEDNNDSNEYLLRQTKIRLKDFKEKYDHLKYKRDTVIRHN